MNNKTYAVAGIAVISVIAVIMAVLFFRPPDTSIPGIEIQEEANVTDLGFTYLQITPGIADYYNLDGDSGVLVTEVISGSMAEKAGLITGDVILSFNGVVIEDSAPLLGMMICCEADHTIGIEISRNRSVNTITLEHTAP